MPWSRPLAGLGPVAAADLTEGRTVRLSRVDPQLAETLQLDEVPSALVLSPVRSGTATIGLAVVSSEQPLPKQTVQAVEGLMAQASLAMERAQLAEDVHRQRVEARFRSLVQNATDLITVIDPTERSATRARRSAGCSATSRPRSRDPLLRPDPRRRPGARAHVRGQLERGQNIVDARLKHEGGDWLSVEITANDLIADANVAGIVLNTRDVSEQRAFEDSCNTRRSTTR